MKRPIYIVTLGTDTRKAYARNYATRLMKTMVRDSLIVGESAEIEKSEKSGVFHWRKDDGTLFTVTIEMYES